MRGRTRWFEGLVGSRGPAELVPRGARRPTGARFPGYRSEASFHRVASHAPDYDRECSNNAYDTQAS
ncbi:hypothetical protein Athai_39330 [Actinocatenispora thailandica]|uniref:Uncharacterized protein n=1 Tax=Actinocatenispora thailandica TaxID=227318 RepID=A0A7R7DRA5_9ACTN|nr:hypothetical protein Athai_39330 [Actinocatenispora thailandica]